MGLSSRDFCSFATRITKRHEITVVVFFSVRAFIRGLTLPLWCLGPRIPSSSRLEWSLYLLCVVPSLLVWPIDVLIVNTYNLSACLLVLL